MRVFWWTGLQTGPRCWRNCWRRCRGVEYMRSEEHTSELQSRLHLVCRLLLEKKKSMIDRMDATQSQHMGLDADKAAALQGGQLLMTYVSSLHVLQPNPMDRLRALTARLQPPV